MALRIEYSKAALDDLAHLTRHGAFEFGQAAARAYAETILSSLDMLASFPMAGTAAGSRNRTLMVRSHRIIYRPEPDRILILRILHARQVPPLLE